ncbi:MAG: potassium channel protein [Bacteroidales bacterium]|nr:potassium channel protein [Bacteroidales bacterium]
MDKNNNHNLILAGFYLLAVVLFGTFGYILIGDYSFIDALYMTVITVSTVGFKEARPLDDGGKLFTVILIFASLGILTYFFTSLAQSLFQSHMRFFYSGYNKIKGSKRMENHTIVVGHGRNGKQVVDELIAFGSQMVVIDQDHELVISKLDSPVRFIEGNATEDEVLIKANIKKARSLITTLPNDADNLFVVLTARSLNPDLKIISRASSESTEKKLRMAGVDSVVMPERIGGAHMATLVAQPDVVEFLEHLTIHGEGGTQLMEIMCSDLPSEFINKPIREIGIRRFSGANIIGFKTAAGEMIMNPTPDTRLIPNSKLFVLATKDQLKQMVALLSGNAPLPPDKNQQQ